MDAEHIKKNFGHLALIDLPEDVRIHVATQPELQQWFRDMESVQMLVSLKRYESADPAAVGRCQHRVITRLQNEPATATPEASRPGRWLTWAMGAAAALLLAMNFAYQALGPDTNAPVAAQQDPIPLSPVGPEDSPNSGFATVGNFATQPGDDAFVLSPTHTNRPATGLRLSERDPDPAHQNFRFIGNPTEPNE